MASNNPTRFMAYRRAVPAPIDDYSVRQGIIILTVSVAKLYFFFDYETANCFHNKQQMAYCLEPIGKKVEKNQTVLANYDLFLLLKKRGLTLFTLFDMTCNRFY